MEVTRKKDHYAPKRQSTLHHSLQAQVEMVYVRSAQKGRLVDDQQDKPCFPTTDADEASDVLGFLGASRSDSLEPALPGTPNSVQYVAAGEGSKVTATPV